MKTRKTTYLPGKCLDCGIPITYRSKRCGPCSRKGEQNYNWKGAEANERAGRARAARMYKSPERCSICGKGGRIHRHHKDHNPANNAPDNVAFLCPSCHRFAHVGREGCKLCGKKVHARMLCEMHYRRIQRAGLTRK